MDDFAHLLLSKHETSRHTTPKVVEAPP